MDVRAILDGAVSGDAKSNINHPFAKLFFVALYLVIAIMLILKRWISGGFLVVEMWILFWIIFASQNLDFREGYVSRYLRRLFWIVVVAVFPIILGSQELVDHRGIFRWIRFVVAYVSLEDIVIFLYGIGAGIAAGRLYSLDVLWLGNKFPEIVRSAFVPTMITYFACKRFLAESTRQIFDSAAFKMRLVKKHGIRQRIASYVGSIATQIIPRFREIVGVIEATLRERDMLSGRRRSSVPVHATVEDYIACAAGTCSLIYSATLLFGSG